MSNKLALFDFTSLTNGSPNCLDISKYSQREKIEVLEWIILNTMNNIADELPLRHFIHDGVYARAMMIPKGVVLTGKIHLLNHYFVLNQGDLSVMTDDGMKRIQAPYVFKARAGLKKIGFAHSDVVCTTYHLTDLTDIEEIENKLFYNGNIDWVDDMVNKYLLEHEVYSGASGWLDSMMNRLEQVAA